MSESANSLDEIIWCIVLTHPNDYLFIDTFVWYY